MTMNTGDPNTRRDGEEPKAPTKLVAALKEPPSRRVFVPPAIDQTIITAARRHLAKPERAGFSFFRSWRLWPTLATACFALVGLIYLVVKPGWSSAKFAHEDLNQDGRVDILDAFQLARDVHAGTKLPANLDLNGDGVVDGRDAQFIATGAVKLEKGGKS